MSPDAFHAAALALPGATFDVKWGADAVFSVGGKMFAAYGIGAADPKYSFMASEIAREALVGQGAARPAPYSAKWGWIQLVAADALPDSDVTALLGQAHALVAAKLSAKKRRELGIAG